MSLAPSPFPASQTAPAPVITDAERRAEAIQRFLDEEDRTQRLIGDRRVVDRIIEQLTDEGWPETAIDRVLTVRLQCIRAIVLACAFCSRVHIKDGIVAVEGLRADEYRKRLAPFNKPLRPHGVSAAAFYLSKLTK